MLSVLHGAMFYVHGAMFKKRSMCLPMSIGLGAMRVRVCTRPDGARTGRDKRERRRISSRHELHGPVDGHEAHAEVVDVVGAGRAREAALGLGPYHQ